MESRTALGVALVSASLAVALVSVDLAWNFSARLEVDRAGDWVTAAEAGGRGFYGPSYPYPGCVSGDLRLVVENTRPLGTDVDVTITYYDVGTRSEETFLRDTWRLDRFTTRTLVFTLPEDAYGTGDGKDGLFGPGTVTVRVDDLWLSACLEGA